LILDLLLCVFTPDKINSSAVNRKMNLQHRMHIMSALGDYMGSDSPGWQLAKNEASEKNGWFLPAFVDLAAARIREAFLLPRKLDEWTGRYPVPDRQPDPKTVGLVLAGNIPLVGFHDMLCVFISGHRQLIKPSSRDHVLVTHIVNWLWNHYPDTTDWIQTADILRGGDAYIATGSDHSARYFEQYFARFPHIIRRNRTSVALLDGTETTEELDRLSDDIQTYFGLGCRNVTQLLVPLGYDFIPLLGALRKYEYFTDAHKYRNNFDYNLAIALMNKQYYMSNGSILLIENENPVSPIGQLHYRYYSSAAEALTLMDREKIQCLVGHGHLPFGQAQHPGLSDYADGVDTMAFLISL
jgi:hypothetical protein